MLRHGAIQRSFNLGKAADSAVGVGPRHPSTSGAALPDRTGNRGWSVRCGHRSAVVRQSQDRHSVASTFRRTALGRTLGDRSSVTSRMCALRLGPILTRYGWKADSNWMPRDSSRPAPRLEMAGSRAGRLIYWRRVSRESSRLAISAPAALSEWLRQPFNSCTRPNPAANFGRPIYR
jgi:hypothetical protein